MLHSMRENHLLADTKLETIGKMGLYEGPLGKVFGGSDPQLKFSSHTPVFKSITRAVPLATSHTMRATMREVTRTNSAKTDKEILDFFTIPTGFKIGENLISIRGLNLPPNWRKKRKI